MTCAELASARKNSLAVISIVINDRIYGTIKRMQSERYGGRHIGIDLQKTDFVKLAEAFDVPGIKVAKPDELKRSLEKALRSESPYLIEVLV